MYKAIKIFLSLTINSNKLLNCSPNKCPDQYIGRIGRNKTGVLKICEYDTKTNEINNNIIFSRINTKNATFKACKNVIVLVLESPHIEEFDPITKLPNGPACGKTGKNIKKYLPTMLDDIIDNKKSYHLVLVNAVQHQCSLGENTHFYRDAMFLYFWESEYYSTDFVNRLNNILSQCNGDKIIINACTKGEHLDLVTNHKGGICKKYIQELGITSLGYKKSLKEYVEVKIKNIDHFSNIKLYRTSHPYSWHVERYRKIEKV